MARTPYCTIVGYVFDHESEFCKECARDLLVVDGVHKKRLNPIFDATEYPSQPTCTGDDCREELAVTVTN